MALGHHRHFEHARHQRNHPFDFGGCNVFAADLQHVFRPVGKVEPAVFAERDPIAGDEPALRVERVGGGLRVVEVFGKERQAAHAPDQEVAGFARLGVAAVNIDAQAVFGRAPPHRERGIGQLDQPHRAMGDGLGHAPPAKRLDAKVGIPGRLAHAGAPQAIAMVGHRLIHQRFRDEADHRGPGAALFERHRPEAAGGKAWIDDCGRARPHRGKHRVGLRVGVKERQRDHVDVVGSQRLVAGIDARTPERIGMGPEHALGPRSGTRGVLHAEGRQRIVRTGGQDRRVTINRIEGIGGRRARRTRVVAIVGGGDCQPSQSFAGGGNQRGKARLRDAGHHLGMVGEIAEFVGA